MNWKSKDSVCWYKLWLRLADIKSSDILRKYFEQHAVTPLINAVSTLYRSSIKENMEILIRKYGLEKGTKPLTWKEMSDHIYMVDQKYAERGMGFNRIKSDKHAYMMPDCDFNDYLDQIDIELKRQGIKPQDMDRDICPALKEETRLRDLNRAMVELFCEVLDLPFEQVLYSLKTYRDMTDKIVAMMAAIHGNKLNIFKS